MNIAHTRAQDGGEYCVVVIALSHSRVGPAAVMYSLNRLNVKYISVTPPSNIELKYCGIIALPIAKQRPECHLYLI